MHLLAAVNVLEGRQILTEPSKGSLAMSELLRMSSSTSTMSSFDVARTTQEVMKAIREGIMDTFEPLAI